MWCKWGWEVCRCVWGVGPCDPPEQLHKATTAMMNAMFAWLKVGQQQFQIILGNLQDFFCINLDQIYLPEKNTHGTPAVPCKSIAEQGRQAATPVPCTAAPAGMCCSWGTADAHRAADTTSLPELGQGFYTACFFFLSLLLSCKNLWFQCVSATLTPQDTSGASQGLKLATPTLSLVSGSRLLR